MTDLEQKGRSLANQYWWDSAPEMPKKEDFRTAIIQALKDAFNDGMMHVRVDRQYVSVHGADGCYNCETGRITTYASSRWCVGCLHKEEERLERNKSLKDS